MRVTEDMSSEEKLSLSLYMFKCYLLYLYKVLTRTLYSAVVDVNLNFQTLSNCKDQTGIFILLVIFGIYAFLNDKETINSYIHY